MNKITRCPVCGTDSSVFCFTARDSTQVKRCSNCHILYRFVPDSLPFLDYGGDLYTQWGVPESQQSRNLMRMSDFRRFLLYVRNFKPFGEIIDVGCATGELLACAEEQGYRGIGVEPQRAACEIARSRYGLAILNTDFLSAQIKHQTADVVTMIHVLEHISDPIAVLRKTWDILKPAGILALETPYLSAFWAHTLEAVLKFPWCVDRA